MAGCRNVKVKKHSDVQHPAKSCIKVVSSDIDKQQENVLCSLGVLFISVLNHTTAFLTPSVYKGFK